MFLILFSFAENKMFQNRLKIALCKYLVFFTISSLRYGWIVSRVLFLSWYMMGVLCLCVWAGAEQKEKCIVFTAETDNFIHLRNFNFKSMILNMRWKWKKAKTVDCLLHIFSVWHVFLLCVYKSLVSSPIWYAYDMNDLMMLWFIVFWSGSLISFHLQLCTCLLLCGS